MNLNKQDQKYPVGAQFIGASPIYRPAEHIHDSWADQSAMGAMMHINKLIRPLVGADLSRTPPIDRPSAYVLTSALNRQHA